MDLVLFIRKTVCKHNSRNKGSCTALTAVIGNLCSDNLKLQSVELTNTPKRPQQKGKTSITVNGELVS